MPEDHADHRLFFFQADPPAASSSVFLLLLLFLSFPLQTNPNQMVKHVQAGISAAAFRMELEAQAFTLVDFFATWCGPCMAISPHIDNLSGQYPHVSFLKVCPSLSVLSECLGKAVDKQSLACAFFSAGCGPVPRDLAVEQHQLHADVHPLREGQGGGPDLRGRPGEDQGDASECHVWGVPGPSFGGLAVDSLLCLGQIISLQRVRLAALSLLPIYGAAVFHLRSSLYLINVLLRSNAAPQQQQWMGNNAAFAGYGAVKPSYGAPSWQNVPYGMAQPRFA